MITSLQGLPVRPFAPVLRTAKPSLVMLGICATFASLASLAVTHAQAQSLPGATSPAPAAQARPVGQVLRGLLLVSQYPASGATAKDASPVAARDICRPGATGDAAPYKAAGASVDVPALRQRLVAVPASAPAADHIASEVPEQLLPAAAIRQQLAAYVGKPLDSTLTTALVNDVVAVVKQNDRYLVDVYLPEQNSSDGVLVLVVQPALLGKVSAKGQQFHEANDITCRIRAQAGQPVDLKALADDLAQLNSSSSWRSTAAPEFSPGAVPGTTDLTLNTLDEKPLRFFVGADNTGSRITGEGRYRAGVNVGNFLGRFDHQFDYTLTTSSSYKGFSQHSFAYQMPLEGRQRLTARFDTSQSDVSIQDGLFRSKGTNHIASLEWTRPQLGLSSAANPGTGIAGMAGMAGESSFGLEYKRIGNSVAFNEVVLSDKTPEILQVFGAWRGAWQGSLGAGDKTAATSSQIYTRLTVSPGGLLANNNDDTFNAVSPGARAAYWRLNAAYNGQLELPAQWSLGLNVNAQVANKALVSSERMTLGGWGGVRGYYSDTLTADAGVTSSIELLSPRRPLDIGGQTGQWHGLVFVDAGRSWNASSQHNADLNKTASQFSLVSHGVGLRYETSRHSHFKLDVARPHFAINKDRQWVWHGSWQVAF